METVGRDALVFERAADEEGGGVVGDEGEEARAVAEGGKGAREIQGDAGGGDADGAFGVGDGDVRHGKAVVHPDGRLHVEQARNQNAGRLHAAEDTLPAPAAASEE
jgi:hypothetical protein